MAEQGLSASLEDAAAAALERIEAPVLTIIGNHDYAHFPRVTHTDRTDLGFFNFARAFHGIRLYRTVIDGWDLVGFDSGPSVFSWRILTRGISDDTLGRLRDVIGDDAAARRGTLLFSHAPTRAALSSDPRARGSHRLGSMHAGGRELERIMLDGAARGRRLLHVAGHTHWSDLFVARRDASDFERVPFDELGCETPLGAASLINAPSATRISFHALRHGGAFGFVHLVLSDERSTARFHLYDGEGRPLRCPR
jgi:hypothetical protein